MPIQTCSSCWTWFHTGSKELVLMKTAHEPAKAFNISSAFHPSPWKTSTPKVKSCLLASDSGLRVMPRTWKLGFATRDRQTEPPCFPVAPKTVIILAVEPIVWDWKMGRYEKDICYNLNRRFQKALILATVLWPGHRQNVAGWNSGEFSPSGCHLDSILIKHSVFCCMISEVKGLFDQSPIKCTPYSQLQDGCEQSQPAEWLNNCVQQYDLHCSGSIFDPSIYWQNCFTGPHRAKKANARGGAQMVSNTSVRVPEQ